MTIDRTTTAAAAAALVMTALLFAGSGCASSHRKGPDVIGPDEERIERVALTPMIRATPGEVRSGVGESVMKNLEKVLKRRGITSVAPADATVAPSLEEEDLKEPEAGNLRGIGPADERLVLVVFLTDWSSKITFGSTCTAEVTGYLVDKRTGRVVWHGKGNGKAGQGGLVGMMMKRASDHDAITGAVWNLMSTFPKAVSRV